MNSSKKLYDLTEKLRKKLEYSKNVHTNPVEVGIKDLEEVIYYLEQLEDELGRPRVTDKWDRA